MVLILGLLEGEVNLILQLGQVGDLVQQRLVLRDLVGKLLLEGVDQAVLLLLAHVQGLDDRVQLLNLGEKLLDPLLKRGDLYILIDDGILELMDGLVGIGVLLIQDLKLLHQLGDLLLEILDVGEVGVVLISLVLEVLLEPSDLVLQVLDPSLETPDFGDLVLDDALLFMVDPLLLSQLVVQVIELALELDDGVAEVVVVLLQLSIVELQLLVLISLPVDLLLKLGVDVHKLPDGALVLLHLGKRGGEVGLQLRILSREPIDRGLHFLKLHFQTMVLLFQDFKVICESLAFIDRVLPVLMLRPQLFLKGLDLALQVRDLLVLVVDLGVGGLKLGTKFLNELLLAGDPVLQ